VHHRWHGTHRYDIQVLATHASTCMHWYSSLLKWSVPLGQRGHVAMVGRILCTKCTLHSNHRLTVWYSNTQNDFSPGAAISSLYTLATPSGRNVNYDGKQLTGEKILSCSFYLYRFRKYVSTSFPIINFCNPGVHYETPCIIAFCFGDIKPGTRCLFRKLSCLPLAVIWFLELSNNAKVNVRTT